MHHGHHKGGNTCNNIKLNENEVVLKEVRQFVKNKLQIKKKNNNWNKTWNHAE